MTVGRFAVVLLSVLLLSVISIMTLNFAEKIWLFVIFFRRTNVPINLNSD